MIKHTKRKILRETPIHCVLKTEIKYSLQNSDTLNLLKKLIEIIEKRYYVTVAQYFVQKTHIHLLIITPLEKNLSLALGYIASMLARNFNKRFNRKGRYWADRFYSSVKTTAQQIRRAIHYIAMQIKGINPFQCRFSSLSDDRAIPKVVLNKIGVGKSVKKFEDVVFYGKAPYHYIRKTKVMNELQLSFF